MASSFKESNNIYTKRPAVALFRKPLVNNDEMSDILEGMLDIYASVEQQSVSKYVGPKYKAIYWNHLTGLPFIEKYGELFTFYRVSPPADPFAYSSANTAISVLTDSYPSLKRRLTATFRDLDFSFPEIGFSNWKLEGPFAVDKRNPAAEKIRSEYKLQARTFDLWVIDSRLSVVLNEAAKEKNYSYLPYLDFFESIKEISDSRSFKHVQGKKILEELQKSGIQKESIRLYQIVLKENVIWKKFTQSKLDDEVRGFFSIDTNRDYLNWSGLLSLYPDYIKNKLGEKNLSSLVSSYPLTKDYVSITPPITSRGIREDDLFWGSDTTTSTSSITVPIKAIVFYMSDFLTSIKNYTLTPNLKNKLVSGSLIFSEFPSKTFPYKTVKGKEIYITYTKDNKWGLCFKINNASDIYVADLINIYIQLCRLSSETYFFNREDGTLLKDKTTYGGTDKLYAFGYDSPLRITGKVNSIVIKGDNIAPVELTDVQTETLLELARIRATVSSEVITKTILKRKLAYGPIPTVLDFKLEYYAKIFERYVKPRYEKHTEFIKSGLMKVYPTDILDEGEELLMLQAQKNSAPTAYSGLTAEKSYYSYEDVDSEVKLRLAKYFESVYFSNYSGFYTTSTTPLSETISPYANTQIDNSNLPSGINDQASLILAAISSLGAEDDIFSNINNVSNKDVSTIAVSRQARGKSAASIVIKNLNSKYCFSEGQYAGDIIFEPMDEVYVYFPTFDNKITLSFKGYVDSAQYINDKGYHSIGIQASCPLKKLELVRTNVRPSLSSAENSNSEIHPFIVPKQLYESIDQWGPFMFMQALSFYSSMLQKSTIEDNDTYIYTVDEKTKLPIFNDLLLQFLWYRQTDASNTQEKAASALSDLVSKYTGTDYFIDGKPISVSVNKPLANLYTTASNLGMDTNFKATYNVFSQRVDGYTPAGRFLAAQLLGTLQPAWVIGSQDINIVFSDYKTNYEILSETSEKFNCYLYSDKNGVVQFRPPQISLMNLSCATYDNQGTLSADRVLNKNDYNYEVRPDIINVQTTTSYHTQCDDSALVTWLQLSGQNIWGSLNADNGNAVVIQDLPKALKYGIKSQQEQILSGIGNREALYIYGLALLDRQNSMYRSGNIAGLASGDLDLNTTLYSPIDNTVYLADGLTINYNAGGSMTFNIPLKWGRKPLFEIPINSSLKIKMQDRPDVYEGSIFNPSSAFQGLVDTTMNRVAAKATSLFGDIVDYDKLRELLLKAVKKHDITDAYYYQLISYIDYVEEHPQSDYILSSFMFNGYVWDGISSISFEDLILTYFGGLFSQDTGLELAFGINGKGLNNDQIIEASNRYKKSNQKILELHGGALLRTVIPNGSNREKQIRIYVKQSSKY